MVIFISELQINENSVQNWNIEKLSHAITTFAQQIYYHKLFWHW